MAGRIPREFIDDLLARIDIVDLVDSLVPLKKSGSNFMARCPFHTEKTPSFSVNRNKQFFHCFGCGVSGNAISFLMDFNHLDFVEAVEDLAAFLGVDVPREQASIPRTQSKRVNVEESYELLGQVAAFYYGQFRNNPEAQKAIEYFKSRGVGGEVAKDFLLGYAPDQWRILEAQFNREALLRAGLLVKNDDGNIYDRFRGRVMFPIRDRRGRVVGFGGRVLDDSLPKYLNSPETQVFQKNREVYGLYESLEKNAKPRRILVVEGYMDVIALQQYGIDHVVAVLGTAISTTHLDLLFRFTSELVFCFDGDSAGRQAAWRAVEAVLACMRDGRQARVMLLPQGEDPDSLIRSKGIDEFSRMQDQAQSLSDYFFENLYQDQDMSSMEGRAGLVKNATRYLQMLPNGIFQGMMKDKLEKIAQVSGLDIFEKSARLKQTNKSGLSAKKKQNSPARTAIALLLQNPELINVVEQQEIDWEGLDAQEISLFRKIVQRITQGSQLSLPGLVESFRGFPEEKIINQLGCQITLVPEDGVENEFSDALQRMVGHARGKVLEELIAKVKNQELDCHEKKLLKNMLEKK
jgi:DNA primase